jgi:hypothetical protein
MAASTPMPATSFASATAAGAPFVDPASALLGDALDPDQHRSCCFEFSSKDKAVSESLMAQTTIAYLERRYAALEKEIENALQHGPTDHLAIADLIYRKMIVAEEIKHNRRLMELIRRTQTEQT